MKLRILILLTLSCLLACAFTCTPALAHRYSEPISQGSIVHLNDTIDISRIIDWETAGLAYWNDSYSFTEWPTVIIPVNGSSIYHLYLDPKLFRPGTWYKWDGQVERTARHGNYEAFRIDSSPWLPRPSANATGNISDSITPSATLPPTPEIQYVTVKEYVTVEKIVTVTPDENRIAWFIIAKLGTLAALIAVGAAGLLLVVFWVEYRKT